MDQDLSRLVVNPSKIVGPVILGGHHSCKSGDSVLDTSDLDFSHYLLGVTSLQLAALFVIVFLVISDSCDFGRHRTS
jgi:hypothetical protein